MTRRACIDGRWLELREGDTLLAVAQRAGRSIASLCFVEGLAPEGGCRLCLVEVGARGQLAAACHTPAAAGLEVRTESLALGELRREILALVRDARPAGAFRASPEGDELERLLARYAVPDAAPPGRPATPAPAPLDTSHPYVRFQDDRCIRCRRCLHACEEVQGQFVYGIEGRGAGTRLVFGPGERFAESDCTACGACVDACPTGALSDRDRIETVPATRTTRSTCAYCGVGCQIEIETRDERVLRIHGAAGAAVNRGHLCGKGRYAHGYQASPERLREPLLREGEGWRALSWPEAIAWLARRLREIQRRHGPDALGAMTSSRSTNEAAYLLQKLFRSQIGTNNVDCCARVCHASTALALQLLTGTGAASASYADLERARLIVVAGANPTEAHPVVGARIKQAALRGVPLVVIDPRHVELADYAACHLQLRPGTNVPLFNALAKLLVESGAIDRAYVQERLEGFEELVTFSRGLSLEDLARTCEVPLEGIRTAARLIGEVGPTLFVSGLGLSELTQGTASVMALTNLGMLTGSIGRPGAGMLPLRGQNNVQGNADMGSMPTQVTGYQRLDDPAVRRRFAEIWGAPLPGGPGLTLPEMLEAARAGSLRGLWIQGEDPAQSDPDETRVREALGCLELLVVQELFLSETARLAHLVLPAAGALEQEGTFTNGERRIQAVRPALPPPGSARPDWEVIRDVGIALGATWSYASPSNVLEEIAAVAPSLFGGVRFERLAGDGLQWPCPDLDHPGTATVHAERFLRGRGRLAVVEYAPSPEHGVPGFPYLLVTGRIRDHYNVGTMTRRTPNQELAPEDRLEIHPDDAAREGVADGARVGLESRWGATRARARVTARVSPGTLFLSFHQPETHANRVTGPQRDPQSNCPEYKITAVRLHAAGRTS